jgi:hypothetical protein
MHPNNDSYARLSREQFDLFAKHFEIVSTSALPNYDQILIHFRLSPIYVLSKVRPEAIIIRSDRATSEESSPYTGPQLVYSNHALLDFFKEHKVEFKK